MENDLQIKRNIGIDILRLLSMWMIINFHIIEHGGILANTIIPSANNNLSFLLKSFFSVAVNVYALITGYLYINRNYDLSKIIQLWLKVFSYSLGIALIYYIFVPNSIEIKDLITYMFPVMTRKYWYFSAYFALFLFIPYINILIKHLDKTKHRNLIIIITFLFCILGWFCHPFRTEPFNLNNGYSFLWLASLYIIGAYIKLYSNDFNKFKTSSFLFNYINVIGIIFIIHFIIFELTNRYVYVFMNYNSPFILIASICLFLYFSKLKNIKSSSFITNISSLSFGIYLVHEQPLIRQNFIINKFCLWANINPIIMVCNILLTSSFIFIICLLIEYLSSHIFKVLHVKEFSKKISSWINKTIFKQTT